jgi:hypothetical protein
MSNTRVVVILAAVACGVAAATALRDAIGNSIENIGGLEPCGAAAVAQCATALSRCVTRRYQVACSIIGVVLEGAPRAARDYTRRRGAPQLLRGL